MGNKMNTPNSNTFMLALFKVLEKQFLSYSVDGVHGSQNNNLELMVSTEKLGVEICTAEMEYCASAASILAEEIWQIAEGFVEVLRKFVC